VGALKDAGAACASICAGPSQLESSHRPIQKVERRGGEIYPGRLGSPEDIAGMIPSRPRCHDHPRGSSAADIHMPSLFFSSSLQHSNCRTTQPQHAGRLNSAQSLTLGHGRYSAAPASGPTGQLWAQRPENPGSAKESSSTHGIVLRAAQNPLRPQKSGPGGCFLGCQA
jgi:hypothetical protein